MIRFQVFIISLGIGLLFQATVSSAGWFAADFSADVVQGTADGRQSHGKMYVGEGRVRSEMVQNERLLIEIIDPLVGRAWLLDTATKQYQERAVPKVEGDQDRAGNPCDRIDGAECRQLQPEVVNGRKATKWLMRIDGRERLQWNDSQYGFPVQIADEGKVVMAMYYLGQESLQGRKVEHWRALQTSGNGVAESEQWYDPQLNIAIRQVAKDGSYRELQNIRLGEQADSLFTLPGGFRRLEATGR